MPTDKTITKDPQRDNYINYSLDNDYTYDAGNLVLPVAGPDGTPPRVIKTHASIGKRVSSFNSSKVGAPPWIPTIAINTPIDPLTNKPKDIFLGGNVSAPLPQLNYNQNQYIFTLSGQYVYLQAGAPRDAKGEFETGDYPFQTPLISFLSGFDSIANSTLAGSQLTLDTDAGDALDLSNEPIDWTNPNLVWRDTSIPGFFMSAALIA